MCCRITNNKEINTFKLKHVTNLPSCCDLNPAGNKAPHRHFLGLAKFHGYSGCHADVCSPFPLPCLLKAFNINIKLLTGCWILHGVYGRCALYLFDQMSCLLVLVGDSKDHSRPIILDQYLSFLLTRTVFSLQNMSAAISSQLALAHKLSGQNKCHFSLGRELLKMQNLTSQSLCCAFSLSKYPVRLRSASVLS